MAYAPSSYWSLGNRDRRELASWQLAAALAQTLPVAAFSELHDGGGTYDTLQLSLNEQSPAEDCIKINRQPAGRVHLLRAGAPSDPQPLDRLDRIATGRPLGVDLIASETAEIAEFFGSHGTPGPGSAARSLVFMATLLEQAMGRDARERWAWQSGVADSAAGPVAWREELFSAVPAAATLQRREPDPHEQRWWFLTRGGRAVLAVDSHQGAVLIDDRPSDGLTSGNLRLAVAASRLASRSSGPRLPATIDGQSYPTLPQARKAYAAVAQQHASSLVGGPVRPFDPGARITTYAHWFTAGDDQMILVMAPHEDPRSVVTLLAYRLAWQSRHRLEVLLPPGFADAVLRILPWLRTSVRIHLLTDDGLETLVPPLQQEVLSATAVLPTRVIEAHDLGVSKAWLDPLLQGLDGFGLTEQHRPSYCAWKFRGRQVLNAARASGGTLRLTAGTDYTKPTTTKPAAYKIDDLAGPMTSGQVAAARAAIDRSMADRLAGADAGDREHQLQADLDAYGLPGLDTIHHHREYPAWRSAGRDGFIDFLAATAEGALDVVETKVGADAAVALQALEYYIWASACSAQVWSRPGWPSQPTSEEHRISLVLAPDGRGRTYDKYLYGVLEALHLAVPWRVLTVAPGDAPANAPILTPIRPVQLLAGASGGQPSCAPARYPDGVVRSRQDLLAMTGAGTEGDVADALFRELDGAVHLHDDLGLTVFMGMAAEEVVYPFELSWLEALAARMEHAEDERQAAEQRPPTP